MTAILTKPKPFLKWVGGKTQLLPQLLANLPPIWNPKQNYYYEPFIGGGALLFELQPANCLIGDINGDLLNLYSQIATNVEGLIKELESDRFPNTEEDYMNIRSWDRSLRFKNTWSEGHALWAARFLYLNKAGYRGLCRYNKDGQLNMPYGNYSSIDYNFDNLRAISHFLKNNMGGIIRDRPIHWEDTIFSAEKGDFIYFDPPYDPASETSSFTAYSKCEFGRAEQIELKEATDSLTQKGVYVMQSNSATPFILDLYKDYPQVIVEAHRAINNKKISREKVLEVIIKNY